MRPDPDPEVEAAPDAEPPVAPTEEEEEERQLGPGDFMRHERRRQQVAYGMGRSYPTSYH